MTEKLVKATATQGLPSSVNQTRIMEARFRLQKISTTLFKRGLKSGSLYHFDLSRTAENKLDKLNDARQ